MKLNTNKLFHKKFLRAYIQYFKGIEQHISVITFKKPSWANYTGKPKESFYFDITKDNKLKVYCVPYRAYTNITNNIEYNNYKYNKFNVLYNNYLMGVDNYLNHMMYAICEQGIKISSDFSTAMNKHFNESPLKDFKRVNSERMYKDFGGIENFFFKNHIKPSLKHMWQTKHFRYSAARYQRIKFTGFRGMFSLNELYKLIFQNTYIISTYKFRKYLNNIKSPHTYSSKFSVKEFYFYDYTHYKKAMKKFGDDVKKNEAILKEHIDKNKCEEQPDNFWLEQFRDERGF